MRYCAACGRPVPEHPRDQFGGRLCPLASVASSKRKGRKLKTFVYDPKLAAR